MGVLYAITMAMIGKSVFELVVLCALCMCRLPAMAMAAEYPTQPQEMSSPPPSSTMEKPVKANPMSPRQREEQLKQILDDAGYRSLSKLVGELLTQGIIVDRSSPLTLFAPSDEAFKKYMFQSMDPRRILGYHTVKGLFSSPDLARLPVGTKLHTILPGHFLAVTAAPGTREYSTTLGIRVEGVEISHPDMFSDGQFLAIHGIDTFFKAEEEEDSVSVKARWQEEQLGRRRTTYLLEEATIALRDRGYSALAIGLRLAPSILGFDNITVFAPDDNSVFLEAGQDYFNLFGYHVLPNRRFLYADLARLPTGTTLQTLVAGDPSSSLLVTTNFSSSPSLGKEDAQVSINYVCIHDPDVFSNAFIAVHGIPRSFPQLFAPANSTPLSFASLPQL